VRVGSLRCRGGVVLAHSGLLVRIEHLEGYCSSKGPNEHTSRAGVLNRRCSERRGCDNAQPIGPIGVQPKNSLTTGVSTIATRCRLRQTAARTTDQCPRCNSLAKLRSNECASPTVFARDRGQLAVLRPCAPASALPRPVGDRLVHRPDSDRSGPSRSSCSPLRLVVAVLRLRALHDVVMRW